MEFSRLRIIRPPCSLQMRRPTPVLVFPATAPRSRSKVRRSEIPPWVRWSFPSFPADLIKGVGRVNPDGSKGSCSACHARHQFSIEMARKPYTCSECHQGPDVPAYKVYSVSKHGNIFSSVGKEWDFNAVPWRVGKDFTAPTCATCHVSLLTTEEGEVIVERTHHNE